MSNSSMQWPSLAAKRSSKRSGGEKKSGGYPGLQKSLPGKTFSRTRSRSHDVAAEEEPG
jgi:hypothetical protein